MYQFSFYVKYVILHGNFSRIKLKMENVEEEIFRNKSTLLPGIFVKKIYWQIFFCTNYVIDDILSSIILRLES